MKERPILFSAPMIHAIQRELDPKMETRRIVKPQPEIDARGNLIGGWLNRPLNGLLLPKLQDIVIHCPYGQPGDRLWVRETLEISEGAILYAADGEHCADASDNDAAAAVWNRYARDDDGESLVHGKCPSIFMPRWASRILLEVVSVRVERLQDISDDDCGAEGLLPFGGGDRDDAGVWRRLYHGTSEENEHAGMFPRDAFRDLWESINGSGSWAENPYVWVVTFKRLKG